MIAFREKKTTYKYVMFKMFFYKLKKTMKLQRRKEEMERIRVEKE